jgi:RNA polymerase sigma-70 factor, ECF subfamily
MASDRRAGPAVIPAAAPAAAPAAEGAAGRVTLEQLHEDHGAELSAYCLRLTGYHRARAEDVVQETLLRAWLHAGTLDGSHGSVRGWLCRVARNVVIDEARTARFQRELAVADVPEQEQPGGRADELLLSWVVADALQRLSQDHRAVLLECYFHGASVAEAAARLGIPAGTVKSRTHYALRALRLALEEMGVSS